MRPIFFGLATFLSSACSLNRLTANAIGDALAGGTSVYSADNDPELIREALPFGLKMFESLLQTVPDHEGLLLAASRGFAAYAFILRNQSDQIHKMATDQNGERGKRIRNLFLRSRDFALRVLAARHPGWLNQLSVDPNAALAAMTKRDLPFLYWCGVSWGGAISAAKGDPNLLGDLPLAGALVQRVLDLDEEYEVGGAHEFFIAYEASRPGGSIQRARQHYRRALELSAGRRASVHLALAETVSVKEQNLAEFRKLIAAVLAVPLETTTEFRLVNAIARRRALWLQEHTEDFFLDAAPRNENAG